MYSFYYYYSIATEPPGSPAAESPLSNTFNLPVTASVSAVIALIVGLLIGWIFGGCFVYMCMRRRKPMLDQLNTITQNVGAEDTSAKYLTINSAYGSSSKDTAMGQDAVDINGAKHPVTEEAPQYEDMEEIRKAYHNRNEFELSENNAYSRGDDVAESYYDNDEYNTVKND
jgi:hypothetical protein